MTTAGWGAALGEAAGIAPPSPADIDVLVRLAGVAAHASHRTAEPITCWIAATAGLDPAALALAESMMADTT